MKKNHIKKTLIALPIVFFLSSCGLKYQKAITLDEGRALLNGASSTIENFDPLSRTSYPFSLKTEKMAGRVDDNRVTEVNKIEGTYTNTNPTAATSWNSYAMECTRTIWAEGSEETVNEYAVRMRSGSEYEILIDEGYERYITGTYPFLENYFLTYPSAVYKSVTQKLTIFMGDEMRNVGLAGQTNDLFGYTCLSTGNNDLVLIIQSWDFSSLKDILAYADVFSEEEGLPESGSSVNFVEAHFSGGYLNTFIAGYDQGVDDGMKEQGLEKKAKNIENSYRVTFTF